MSDMHAIAARFGLSQSYPAPVLAEVDELLLAPGIDDGALIDRTHLPFVTIDNADSRDLDQALCVTSSHAGWLLWYALADAAFYVRPGSALFAEALARGASFYLPGLSIPMLPRPLSEGLVSLNEAVDRRALLFAIELDRRGEVVTARIERARIRSRRKLSYDYVQTYFDAPEGHALSGQEFTESLRAFSALGGVLLRRAEERGAIGFHGTDVQVEVAGATGTFRLIRDDRNDVDRWNEQISLLTNIEGARFLLETSPSLQPIFRVHPAPEQERIEELARRLEVLVADRDPAIWRWQRESETLPEYLRRLPQHERLTRAIQRQAMVIHKRSLFTSQPGHHYGICADAYARFSSPMREIVGIFTHKEALEKLAGVAGTPGDNGLVKDTRPSHGARAVPGGTPSAPGAIAQDVALRERVIAAGNRSKDLQRQLEKAANKLVIDQLLQRALDDGTELCGTIMGVAPDKVYLQLDEPPIEVKIYLRDFGPFEMDPEGVLLRSPDGVVFRTGEEIRARVAGYDERRDRWKIVPDDFRSRRVVR